MPGVAHLKLRMPSVKHPLIENTTQISAGRILDGLDQVQRFHILTSVSGQIQVHRVPKMLFSENVADQIQDQPTFLIKMSVKEINRLNVNIRYDGSAIAALVFFQVLF